MSAIKRLREARARQEDARRFPIGHVRRVAADGDVFAAIEGVAEECGVSVFDVPEIEAQS